MAKIEAKRFVDAVQSFFVDRAPASTDSIFDKFVLGAMGFMSRDMIADKMQTLGLISDDGMVDLDKIEGMLRAGFKASGGTVKMPIPLSKTMLVFSESDWSDFKRVL